MKLENPQEFSDDDTPQVPLELILALKRLQPGAVDVSPGVDADVMQAARDRLGAIRKHKPLGTTVWTFWPLAAAAACFLLAWLFFQSAPSGKNLINTPIARQEDAAAVILREVCALFPNQVKAILKDESGLQMTLSDEPDVKPGQALLFKICEPKGCREIITFSGQNIEIAGHQVTVRAETGGSVVLDGERFRWSSDHNENPEPGIQIESHKL